MRWAPAAPTFPRRSPATAEPVPMQPRFTLVADRASVQPAPSPAPRQPSKAAGVLSFRAWAGGEAFRELAPWTSGTLQVWTPRPRRGPGGFRNGIWILFRDFQPAGQNSSPTVSPPPPAALPITLRRPPLAHRQFPPRFLDCSSPRPLPLPIPARAPGALFVYPVGGAGTKGQRRWGGAFPTNSLHEQGPRGARGAS